MHDCDLQLPMHICEMYLVLMHIAQSFVQYGFRFYILLIWKKGEVGKMYSLSTCGFQCTTVEILYFFMHSFASSILLVTPEGGG